VNFDFSFQLSNEDLKKFSPLVFTLTYLKLYKTLAGKTLQKNLYQLLVLFGYFNRLSIKAARVRRDTTTYK